MAIGTDKIAGMTGKRADYINWDEYFMSMAVLSAMRSKDPSTQVGACVVSPENRIVGLGYNGFPNKCCDDEFPWVKDSENEFDTKYPYVVHAELNAILNSSGNLKDHRIYVTLFPCCECTKAVIQSGIISVCYLNEITKPRYIESAKASKRMMNAASVSYYRFHSQNEKIEISLKKY